MITEAKEKALPVGFLDPQLLSVTAMEFDRSSMVDYVTRGLRIFAKKEYIMFGHNTGGHWILVVIIPKWDKALYLDSDRNRGRDHSLLKGVLDE